MRFAHSCRYRSCVILGLAAILAMPGCTAQPPEKPRPTVTAPAPPRELRLEGKPLEEWVRLLTGPEPASRRQAVATLAGIEPEGKTALAPLVLEALTHDETDIRHLSACLLGNLAPLPETVYPRLVTALRDPDATVRRSVATALVSLGRQAPDKLAPLLREVALANDADVRQLVAYVQENLGLATGPTLPDETPTPRKSANVATLHADAIRFQMQRQYAHALASMRLAVERSPGNQAFADYLAELEELASRAATDRHALQATPFHEQSLDSLARYLALPAKNDRQKVRAVFRWIADRIAYNAEGYYGGNYGDVFADNVLKNRKAVCEGYSNLFQELCTKAGVEAVVVGGYSKEKAGKIDEKKDGHAWNAVKLDGSWHVLDVTWAAGNLDDKKFKKKYTDYYYLTSPEQFIFSHFPDDPEWQLLTPPITQQEFEKWPVVDSDLFRVGIHATEIRSHLFYKGGQGLVTAHDYFGPRVVVRTAPLKKKLKPGTYSFRIESAGIADIAVINDKDWRRLRKQGNIFEGEVAVKKGKLEISAPLPTLYYALLRYDVE